MATSRGISSSQVLAITECSICTESFKEPKVLPCIHTFCLHCLEKYGEEKKKHPRAQVDCPLCRNLFTIPLGGFKDLPNNYFIIQLMQLSQLSDCESKDENAVCELCSELGETPLAVMFCVKCSQHLCQPCCTRHTKQKCSMGHEVVSLTDKPSSEELIKMAPSYCEQHPTDEIKFYCYDCKMIACVVCYVDKHVQHKCSDVKKSGDEFRVRMKCDIGLLEPYIAKNLLEIQQLKENMIGLKKKVEAIKSEILKKYNELRTMLDSQQNQLNAELDSFQDKKLKEIETRRDELERQAVILESYRRYCEKMIEKGRSCDVSRAANDLQVRAEELARTQSELIGAQQRSVNITFMPSAPHIDSSWIGRLEIDCLDALESSQFPPYMEILQVKRELVVFEVNLFADEEDIMLHFESSKNGGGGDVLGIHPHQNNTSLVLMDANNPGMLFQHNHVLLQQPFKIKHINFSEFKNNEAKMREYLKRGLKPTEDDKEALDNKDNQRGKGDTVGMGQSKRNIGLKSKKASREHINTGNSRKRVEHEAGSLKPDADMQGDDKKDNIAKVAGSNMEGKYMARDVSDIADHGSSARKDNRHTEEDSHPDYNDEDNNIKGSDHQNKRSDATATDLSMIAFTGDMETQESTDELEEILQRVEPRTKREPCGRPLPLLTHLLHGPKTRPKVSPPCDDQDTASIPVSQARKPASAPDEGPPTMFLKCGSSKSSSCNGDNDPGAVAFNKAISQAQSGIQDKDCTGISLVPGRQPRNDSPSMPWSSKKQQPPSPINQKYPSKPGNQRQSIEPQPKGCSENRKPAVYNTSWC